MQGRDKEVECDAPVGENGEEGEGVGGSFAVIARAAPDDADESRDESVEALRVLVRGYVLSKMALPGVQLTMRRRQVKRGHGERHQEVTKRLDGSHRSVPKVKAIRVFFANVIVARRSLGFGVPCEAKNLQPKGRHVLSSLARLVFAT